MFGTMVNIQQVVVEVLIQLRFSFKKLMLATLLVVCFSTINLKTVSAQVIWAGFKAGGQVNLPKIDDAHFRDSVKVNPAAGFNFGAALYFKVKDRFFLQTEYIYSTKNKILRGKLDSELNDHVTYRYAEIPILFTRQAKVRLGAGRTFKWYVGAGPNIAYLLGAKGTIKSSTLMENGAASMDYNNINRLQFGINIGAGFIIEPSPKQKVIVDIRYTFDQTVFGRGSADYLAPVDYNDNFKFRNRTLRFSVLYLMEYNLSKKERNKGKSNKKL